MFQLLPCPNCQRTFSLRGSSASPIAAENWLKCPNCGNQFCLGDLLDSFYPPWQVIAAPGSLPAVSANVASEEHAPDNATVRASLLESDLTVDDAWDGTFAEEPTSVSAVEETYALAPDDGNSSEDKPFISSPRDDEPDGHDIQDTAQGLGKRSHSMSHKSRPRSRQSSPIWSLIQVILGGAASIPVTLLLLWHVIGRDVMNAGPAVAKFAPWIVPSQFHGSPHRQPERPASGNRPPPAPGESGFRNFDDVLPPLGSQPVTPDNSAAADLSAPATSAATSSINDPIKDTLEPTVATSRAVPRQPVENDTLTPRVTELVASTKAKIAACDPNDKQVITAQIIAVLDDLSEMAELLALLPADNGAVRLIGNDIRDLGRSLTANPLLESYFKFAVRAQFNGRLKRPNQGRVYLGTVAEVRQAGDNWEFEQVEEATATAPGYALQAQVAGRISPQAQAGQKLFMLGVLQGDAELPEEAAPNVVRLEASFVQRL